MGFGEGEGGVKDVGCLGVILPPTAVDITLLLWDVVCLPFFCLLRSYPQVSLIPFLFFC